jgi:hypothetical protein
MVIIFDLCRLQVSGREAASAVTSASPAVMISEMEQAGEEE